MVTATEKKKKGVLGPEKRQEKTSLHQIESFFEPWNPSTFEDDLGVDRVFEVVDDDGNPAGVSFNLQAKSCTNLGDYLAQAKTDGVPCELDVKHLLQWEGYSTPVVVILWDTKLATGYWDDVPSILAVLDRDRPAWRTQKTTTVSLMNPCDEGAKLKIQRRIAEICMSIIQGGRPLTLTVRFAFPDTPEGRALDAALRKKIEEGGPPLTIPAENITELKFDDWFQRAAVPMTQGSIVIGQETSSVSFGVRIGAEGEEGILVAMKFLQGGQIKKSFDNSHQRSLVKLRLDFASSEEGRLTILPHFGYKLFGARPFEILRLVQLLRAMQSGKRLFLEHVELGEMGQLNAPDPSQLPNRKYLDWLERFLKKVIAIQAEVARFGQFQIDAAPDASDVRVVEELYGWCTKGEWKQNFPITEFSLTKKAWKQLRGRREEKPDGPFSMSGVQAVDLFGVLIVLGRIEAIYPDNRKLSRALMKAIESKSDTVKLPRIRTIVRVVAEPTDDDIEEAKQRRDERAKKAQCAALGLVGNQSSVKGQNTVVVS